MASDIQLWFSSFNRSQYLPHPYLSPCMKKRHAATQCIASEFLKARSDVLRFGPGFGHAVISNSFLTIVMPQFLESLPQTVNSS
jgi:hypothetical protein